MAYEIILGRDSHEREKYGLVGTIMIGKHYVKMGQVTALSQPVYLDLNRAHVVFVAGKRGSGKCLTGDALVLLDDGTRVPIRELRGRKANVIAYDGETFQSVPWTHFYERTVQRVLTLTLTSGKTITLTPEHPLLTRQGWCDAQSLTTGNNIATYREREACANGCAQLVMALAWDEISAINEHIGAVQVYDITVPDNHNFVANDIIVHNSYALGVIAEGIAMLQDVEIKERLSVVLLDTMGIYWTMKYANHKDEAMFKDWGLEGAGIPVEIHTPYGFFDSYKEKGIPTDHPFSINAGELGPEDWNIAFELPSSDPVAVFIERVVLSAMETHGKNFSIDDLLEIIRADTKEQPSVRNAAENRFMAAKAWGVFGKDATRVRDLAKPGVVSIIDLSPYVTQPNGWKIKTLVLGIVSQKLFVERMISRRYEEFTSVESASHYLMQEEKEVGEKMPIVWLLIDEAHEFLPKDERVGSSTALITLLREGRQPGIAMVMATQQPGKIHTDAMTQSDVILAHRLTAKLDTDALGALVQSYMRSGIDTELENLPKLPGACLAMDDVNERIYPMRIRPRVSWHGGSAPNAIPVKKKIFEF